MSVKFYHFDQHIKKKNFIVEKIFSPKCALQAKIILSFEIFFQGGGGIILFPKHAQIQN